MADDQVLLELGRVLVRNALLGELAKAGGESVDRLSAFEHRLHVRTGMVDGLFCLLGDFGLFTQARNAHDLVNRQCCAVEFNHMIYSVLCAYFFV